MYRAAITFQAYDASQHSQFNISDCCLRVKKMPDAALRERAYIFTMQ